MAPHHTGLPDTAAERKLYPVGTFVREYFPAAIAYLAHLSLIAAKQHGQDEGMFWDRPKSSDHLDTMFRHALQSGETDTDGMLHTGKMAWRALALLQLEIEARANVL